MSTLAQGQPVSIENEFPFHKVRISRPFYISSTRLPYGSSEPSLKKPGTCPTVTTRRVVRFSTHTDRRFEHKQGPSWKTPGWTVSQDQPVVMVSYNDAQAFVEWLSAKEKLPYKLPTEAQWEYAAAEELPTRNFRGAINCLTDAGANYADKNTDFEWRDRTADDGHKYVAPRRQLRSLMDTGSMTWGECPRVGQGLLWRRLLQVQP